MRRNRGSSPGGEPGKRLADEVHDALRALGWVAAQTERDVQLAERQLAEGPERPELPAALRDPHAVRAGAPLGPQGPHATLPLPAAGDADATLARAAREGGRVTPEIEQAMRRDRQAAERDARRDDQHAGETDQT